MHEAAHAVTAGLRLPQDFFDLRAIAESHGRTGRIHHELPREIAGDRRLVREQQSFEFANAVVRAAVGKFSRGVDRLRMVKRERPAVLAEALFRQRLARNRTVAIAPASHHIEALEREARRIDFAMARRASLVRAMLVELLANRDRAANVRLDRDYGRGWRRRDFAEDPLGDPHAAQHRRGRRAVRGYLEHAGLRHQPAAHAVGWERDAPHGNALDPGHAIVPREVFVEKREVGIDHVPRWQIVALEETRLYFAEL